MKYKYRFNYAEDLDLGIRLIKDGNQIAFLGSTRIIHSHNIPASYFLKKGYVDNLFLFDMFNDFPIPKINFTYLIPDIAFTYHFVNEKVINELKKGALIDSSKTVETTIREALVSAHNYTYPSRVNIPDNKYVDSVYPELLEDIFGISEDIKAGEPYRGFLINSLLDYSNIMFKNYLIVFMKNSTKNSLKI